MLRPVTLARTDVSEERIASIIRVTRVGETGTTLAVTVIVVPSSTILANLLMEVISTFETSVLTRAAQHNIPESGILHSHPLENLKSFTLCNLFDIYSTYFTLSAISFIICLKHD
jgi:hypothetical protein